LLAAIQFLKKCVGRCHQICVVWEIVWFGPGAEEQSGDDFLPLRFRQRIDLGDKSLNNRCHGSSLLQSILESSSTFIPQA
jgi:hypothetical protein